MPGGNPIEAKGVGPTHESVELEVSVAFDARIGCPTRRVVIDVGGHHLPFEVIAKVEDVMLNSKPVGHAAGIVDVAHCATTGVGRSAPELHRDTNDLVTGIEQQRSSDGRIDTPRHHHEHRSVCVGSHLNPLRRP
jgi:hypothetical protein